MFTLILKHYIWDLFFYIWCTWTDVCSIYVHCFDYWYCCRLNVLLWNVVKNVLLWNVVKSFKLFSQQTSIWMFAFPNSDLRVILGNRVWGSDNAPSGLWQSTFWGPPGSIDFQSFPSNVRSCLQLQLSFIKFFFQMTNASKESFELVH